MKSRFTQIPAAQLGAAMTFASKEGAIFNIISV